MIKILEPSNDRMRTVGMNIYALCIEDTAFNFWDRERLVRTNTSREGITVSVFRATIKEVTDQGKGLPYIMRLHVWDMVSAYIPTDDKPVDSQIVKENDENKWKQMIPYEVRENSDEVAENIWNEERFVHLASSCNPKQILTFGKSLVSSWMKVRKGDGHPSYYFLLSYLKRYNRIQLKE